MAQNREKQTSCEECQDALLSLLEQPLGSKETEAFRKRYAHCPACLEELSFHLETLALVRSNLAEAEPPPALDHAILQMAREAVEPTPVVSEESSFWSLWDRLFAFVTTPTFKAGLSFALICIVVGGSYVLTREGMYNKAPVANFSAKKVRSQGIATKAAGSKSALQARPRARRPIPSQANDPNSDDRAKAAAGAGNTAGTGGLANNKPKAVAAKPAPRRAVAARSAVPTAGSQDVRTITPRKAKRKKRRRWRGRRRYRTVTRTRRKPRRRWKRRRFRARPAVRKPSVRVMPSPRPAVMGTVGGAKLQKVPVRKKIVSKKKSVFRFSGKGKAGQKDFGTRGAGRKEYKRRTRSDTRKKNAAAKALNPLDKLRNKQKDSLVRKQKAARPMLDGKKSVGSVKRLAKTGLGNTRRGGAGKAGNTGGMRYATPPRTDDHDAVKAPPSGSGGGYAKKASPPPPPPVARRRPAPARRWGRPSMAPTAPSAPVRIARKTSQAARYNLLRARNNYYNARNSVNRRNAAFETGRAYLAARKLKQAKSWFRRYLSLTSSNQRLAALRRIKDAYILFRYNKEARQLLQLLMRKDALHQSQYKRELQRLR